MKLLNWFVFGGLSLSGGMMLLGLFPGLERLLVMHFLGYWFGLAAIVIYLAATIGRLLGRLTGFWVTLIPINFGLAGMGFALVAWNPLGPDVIPIVLLAILAATFSGLIRLDQFRVSAILPLLSVFIGAITENGWAALTGTAIWCVGFPIVVAARVRFLGNKFAKSNHALKRDLGDASRPSAS